MIKRLLRLLALAAVLSSSPSQGGIHAMGPLSVGTPASADHNVLNRGIGRYPRSPKEYTAPRMVRDDTYRNVALHRSATASSSMDWNLTAQLLTDGIVSKGIAPTITVSTNRGIDRTRARLRSIDGNPVTPYYIYGPHAWIQYDWTAMSITLDTLRLITETAFNKALATQGWSVAVMGSDDGKTWRLMGKVAGKGVPGYVTQQTASDDPNNHLGTTRLPLSRGKLAIPLSSHRRLQHLRLEFQMPGAVWWRLCEVDEGSITDNEETFEMYDVKWPRRNMQWLPSEHFFSCWMSAPVDADSQPQWASIDMGTQVQFDKVVLRWINRPTAGKVQVSDDGKKWSDVCDLPKQGPLTETLKCQGQGRYVRLWLTQPDATGRYALTEVEVMGRGGLHAEPANTLDIGTGKRSLNQWQVRRAGDSQWVEATVPGTVQTSYMNIGAVPYNLYANNMRQISESFFNADFIYRTSFKWHPDGKPCHYLNTDGIDWKSVITLNGREVGRTAGAFIRGRFDVSSLLRDGQNTLEVHVVKNAHPGAVKVANSESTDINGGVIGLDSPTFSPTMGWDWITSTPGRCMGIWNDVYLTADEGVRVADPYVTTTLNHPDTLASMTPAALVSNESSTVRTVTVKGWIGSIQFERTVTLQGGEKRTVSFSPEEFPQLSRQRMRLWWPNGYGEPYLYDAGFTVSETGRDVATVNYKAGIREMAYKDMDTQLKLWINGKRFVPLGGNWGFPESNLTYRGREYDVTLRYHREMGMNLVRNWVGQVGDDEFFDACDKYGIMVWQDFWLANPWDGPDPQDETMFMDNARDVIQRLRRHPSIALYCGRNEGYPPASLDKSLRRAVAELHSQLGYIGSSADGGVSGRGPYGLWTSARYFSHLSGKLHSEEGISCIPNYESLKRMLAPEGLWPMGDAWGQHDFPRGRGHNFAQMVERHFGPATSARQFTEWAQWVNYDGHRAMFESRLQDRMGVLIWMSHPCWPALTWATYDYYWEPTAAYFGIRKALEPIHIQYNPAQRTVEVANISVDKPGDMKATAQVLSMWGNVISEHTADVAVDRDETVSPMRIEVPDSAVYFIKLKLEKGGRLVSENFYVEGRDTDNLQALHALPTARIHTESHFAPLSDNEWKGQVTVANEGDVPALLIRLCLKGEDGQQILPVIYSDNYFSLMPGESRTVDISYDKADARGCRPVVSATPLNLHTETP